MDPSSNHNLQNAKLQTLLSTSQSEQHMPPYPPPSYHMVVDPHAPIPNLRSPYDPEDEEKEDDEDELPEVTINATTQIRGHGNIISVPPMDAVRIAGLLHTMMYGPPGQPASPLHSHASTQSSPYGSITRTRMKFPKMNITVNCGTTIFGDKNVVGPGLGEVARQMQIARSQQQAQAQAAVQAQAARAQGFQQSQPIPAMAMPVLPILNPPMMRRTSSDSGSESSVGSGKRKAEDEGEFSPGPKRRDSNEY